MYLTEWVKKINPKKKRYTSLKYCLDQRPAYAKETRCRLWKIWTILIISTVSLYLFCTHTVKLYEVSHKTVSIERKKITNIQGYSTTKIRRPMCSTKLQSGHVSISKTILNLSTTQWYPMVKKGGHYSPRDCQIKKKLAVLLPYKDRKMNLAIFLQNIHPYLIDQHLDYRIFVVETYGNLTFNKGHLYNAGFREIMKYDSYYCIVFHDLDLLPMRKEIPYTCSTFPRHMSATINDSDVKYMHRVYRNSSYDFKSLFGGVVAMTPEVFRRVNGFSNMYIGWGGEDNDMFFRLRARGYPVMRYNSTIGVYLVLPHRRANENRKRHKLLSKSLDRYKTDGLCNANYKVISTNFFTLSTHILIQLKNVTKYNATCNYRD